MTTALLIVQALLLVSFWLACGAILWELRRARFEAKARGQRMLQRLRSDDEVAEFLLVLDEQIRRGQEGRRKTGVRGDGT